MLLWRLYNLFQQLPIEKMPVLEAYRHIKEDLPYANCASAVIHALSPQTPGEETTLAVLDYNAQSLTDIAACVMVEHRRAGNYSSVFTMPEGQSPSDFYRDLQRQSRHTGDGAFFIGGLMATVEQAALDTSVLHVVGVLNHHDGPHEKFTVCDTSRMKQRELIRKMTAREMDSRIIHPGVYPDHRALALIGYPIADLEQDPDLYGNLSYFENEAQLAQYRVYQMLDKAGLLGMVTDTYRSGV